MTLSSTAEREATTNAADDEQDSGVEIEQPDPQEEITNPFDPERIKIRTSNVLIGQLVSRIGYQEIDLAPDFQRLRGIWNAERKSRLIESLLLKIPLPVFYVASTEEENWTVVDGVQRMSTIYDFVKDRFPLSRLEYLDWLNGFRHGELPRNLQRRIDETALVVNVIEPGTPPEVMFNVFLRINTGGMTLNGQEIRHALHPGPVRDYLKELAQSDAFTTATGNSIRETRMADRECVLRFLAFHVDPWEDYVSNDLDDHLRNTMEKINEMSIGTRGELTRDFERAMWAARDIFGKYAFRKRYDIDEDRLRPVSKALFEAWSVQLARCSPEQVADLVRRREEVAYDAISLLGEDGEFERAISYSTGTPRHVRKRFKAIKQLVDELL